METIINPNREAEALLIGAKRGTGSFFRISTGEDHLPVPSFWFEENIFLGQFWTEGKSC